MANKISARRLQMGEEAWAEYQKQRIKDKSDAQTARDKNSRKVMRYRRAMKARLIEYKGGKCQECGYDRPFPSAYHFHHRDPNTKSFSISARGCTLNFDTLRAEVEKCDLLCANCHAELHDVEHQNNEFLKADDLIGREMRKPAQAEEKSCPSCENIFQTNRPNQRFCSLECRELDVAQRCKDARAARGLIPAPRKVERPDKLELEMLLRVNSWTAVGKMYGVSDNAVRKWAKSYDLVRDV